MKNHILVFLIVLTFKCSAQDYRQFYSKEFNWRLNIPDGFESLSEQKNAEFSSKGKKVLENVTGQEITDNSKQIFLYNKHKINYILSNWQDFDETKDGKYLTSVKFVNEAIFKSFQHEIPQANIDSVSSSEVISNIVFHVFHITIPLPNSQAKMNMYMFSHLFDKRDFNVYIVFLDEETGKELLKNLRASTFEN